MPVVGSVEGAGLAEDQMQQSLLRSMQYNSGLQAYAQAEKMNPLQIQHAIGANEIQRMDVEQRKAMIDWARNNPVDPNEPIADTLVKFAGAKQAIGDLDGARKALQSAGSVTRNMAVAAHQDLMSDYQQIKNELNFLDYMGQNGYINPKSPPDQKQRAWSSIRQMAAAHGHISVDQLNPDIFPETYSDEAYQAFQDHALGEKTRRELALKQITEERQKLDSKSRRDVREQGSWFQKQKIADEQEREKRLTKSQGARGNAGPTQGDLDFAANLIVITPSLSDLVEPDGKKVTPIGLAVAREIAQRAKQISRDSDMNMTVATKRALQEKIDSGELKPSTVPKTILGVPWGTEEKVIPKDLGVTKDAPMPPPRNMDDDAAWRPETYYSDGAGGVIYFKGLDKNGKPIITYIKRPPEKGAGGRSVSGVIRAPAPEVRGAPVAPYTEEELPDDGGGYEYEGGDEREE